MRELFRRAIFLILGIFSLLYVIYASSFAEIRVYIPYLNFPVFIGEIFLFFCFVFSLFIFDLRSIKGWQWGVVIYFTCVILKALWGYIIWGPLAFRHAALFYYPIFIFFGYISYKKLFLSEPLKIFAALLIFSLCITKYFYEYWTLTLWIIAFILIKSFNNKIIKHFFYGGLLLAIFLSYKNFILTSRTFIIGNLTAVIFLTITSLFIVRIKTLYKAIAVGIMFITLITLVFKYSSHNAAITIFDIRGTISRYQAIDAQIKSLLPSYIPQDIKTVRLFNPEHLSRIDSLDYKINRGERYKKIETIKQPVSPQEVKNYFVSTNKETDSVIHLVLPPEKTKLTDVHFTSEVNFPHNMDVFIPQHFTNLKSNKISLEETINNTIATNKSINKKISVENAYYYISFFPLVWKSMVSEFFGYSPMLNYFSDGQKDKSIVENRNAEDAYGNTMFRLFIWRDMISEFSQHWPFIGFSFGKPLRSKSMEITYQAMGVWTRDGWIEPHNSYLNMLYRMGVLGVMLIGFLIWQFFRLAKGFIVLKSLSGILLCSVLINWLVAANFLPILELPYSAIPFWTIWGITLGYLKKIQK